MIGRKIYQGVYALQWCSAPEYEPGMIKIPVRGTYKNTISAFSYKDFAVMPLFSDLEIKPTKTG